MSHGKFPLWKISMPGKCPSLENVLSGKIPLKISSLVNAQEPLSHIWLSYGDIGFGSVNLGDVLMII